MSAGVEGTRIGSASQSSPAGSGTSIIRFGSLLWLNQSRIWNCSQAAASTLSVEAGLNVVRRSSSLLTVRGFGSNRAGGTSARPSSSGTLRPKRVPAIPIDGNDRSL